MPTALTYSTTAHQENTDWIQAHIKMAQTAKAIHVSCEENNKQK